MKIKKTLGILAVSALVVCAVGVIGATGYEQFNQTVIKSVETKKVKNKLSDAKAVSDIINNADYDENMKMSAKDVRDLCQNFTSDAAVNGFYSYIQNINNSMPATSQNLLNYGMVNAGSDNGEYNKGEVMGNIVLHEMLNSIAEASNKCNGKGGVQ